MPGPILLACEDPKKCTHGHKNITAEAYLLLAIATFLQAIESSMDAVRAARTQLPNADCRNENCLFVLLLTIASNSKVKLFSCHP